MKQFFKMLFASTLGVILASIILTVVSIIIVISIAVSSSTPEVTVENNSIFKLKLSGQIIDRSEKNIYEIFNPDKDNAIIGLDDIISSIHKAKNNENIKGILLESNILSVGISSAKEIRNALLDFKQSGKFIIANSGLYTQNMYYISSVADKIIMNPIGMLEFRGLSSNPVFYKKALDKLGIEMQVIKVGTYKSFAEQYTNTEMSDHNREQVSVFIQSIWESIIEDISDSRQLSKEKLNSYADQMMAFQEAEKSVEYGLIDTLMYDDEVKKMLASYVGIEDTDDLNFISLSQMNKLPNTDKEYVPEKIAIVYAIGDIDNGASSFDNDGIQSSKMIKTLEKIRKDDDIKSVVIRINSPGGSAYGSEQIWRAVSLLKKKKPVIISMGDYAASGGYYIASGASVIVAEPTTLTGSIGIFGIIPNTEKLMDKLGITFDNVKTNTMADMPSLHRPLNNEEKNIMQVYITKGYELFVKRCAAGRNISEDSIRTIAEGRVWTGKDAKKIGLVDSLGDLQDAIKIAAQQAGLSKYRTSEYPEKKDFFTSLIEDMEGNIQTKILKTQLGENYRHYIQLKKVEKMENIQAYLPFEIDVK